MTDIVNPATRSRMMSGIKGKNTKPELQVRRLLHKRGFRFRLHRKDLAGKPDLVLPRYKAVLFVHGCFWHGHSCKYFRWPSSHPEFWRTKIGRNQSNDAAVMSALLLAGWRVAVVWECALRSKTDEELEETGDAISSWLKSDEISVVLPPRRR
ncbi:MAG: DNA mismatch endonuclease Vsr [Hydrogenophaga sp.]|nr:DNA mismatch endonuclease Vsr [Hydrogenophaga sp.]MDO9148924.1 very short patch repair endonuclease [Hydrogenophaga sp.]